MPIELKPTCAPQFMPMAKEMDIPMRYSRGCLAGIAYCCIIPNGDVHICPYLPISTGNIREKSFDKIWKESEIFNKLRDFSKYEGKCGECGSVEICGGCRAITTKEIIWRKSLGVIKVRGEYIGRDRWKNIEYDSKRV